MSTCWYCHWGWAKAVQAIYDEFVEELGDNNAMHYGPAHIVWEDENFDDDSIRHCLAHEWSADAYPHCSQEEFAVVRRSLEKLMTVPESVRCCEPEEYDGEHPDRFPPVGVEMARA